MSNIKLDDLNIKKLNQMKVDILTIEQENLKTREKSNDAMIEMIRKIIVDEINKAY